ncbi:MAG: ChuX/HutX family heme-like substrate-binding protein [Bacteroidota bacterium]
MKNLDTLKQQMAELKAQEPKLRNRDLAHKLNISEAELLSLSTGEHVTRLEGDWKELLVGIKDMGYVMALTRNENCVHERKGVYDNIEFYGGPHNMGVAVNPDIDLRFFMNEWVYALAVIMERQHGTLYSFQFFNKKGEAVHKVFSTPKSDIDAYHALVEKFKAENQTPLMDVDHSPYPEKTHTADAEIDVEGFQQAWKDLKDTHDFFGLLRKYKVNRTQGFRLAPEGFTQKIDNESVIRMLQKASETATPIMCFLHSKGCVQIHSGTVKKLQFYGDWYNVLDPRFNLHLSMPAVKESWIVKKPTVDGIVTSLELFDEEGNQIVYFFGARKPGKAELEEWRAIIKEVENEFKQLDKAQA